jgi:F-type H+-transporting ATPase subunit gamma
MAESTREILRRIKGIKSTQQITKAMEMVSAVKLNRVRARAESARPYVDNMQQMMQALCASAEETSHPLLSPREEVKKILLVVVTSDRGLCGTFNVNVINAAKEFIEENNDKEVTLLTIGAKGNDALSRVGYSIVKTLNVPWGDEIAVEMKKVSSLLEEIFLSMQADRVCLLYSKFENVLRYVPTIVEYLPVPSLDDKEMKSLLKLSSDFLIEPGFDEVADFLVPKYLETRLYHSVVESLASEYAARMVSMRNANDNAEEVIKELNLIYNKARQASITTELIDIIGGVEALNG